MVICFGTAQGPRPCLTPHGPAAVAEGEMSSTHLRMCMPLSVYVDSAQSGKQAAQRKPFKYLCFLCFMYFKIFKHWLFTS